MAPDIDLIAIFIAAGAAFLVGALWYGPLFGKEWRVLMGVSDGNMEGMKTKFTKTLVGGFLSTLVLSFVLANLIGSLPNPTIGAGLIFGFWVWLGFVATILLNSVLYENRSWKLYFINAAHYLVAILVAALILSWWPW